MLVALPIGDSTDDFVIKISGFADDLLLLHFSESKMKGPMLQRHIKQPGNLCC